MEGEHVDTQAADPFLQDDNIVITAARVEREQAESAASSTVVTGETIERIGEPMTLDFLRLTPSAAVSVSGTPGSQAQVRIRGAEANHTLLFVDGIRANDPAAANEPRFESSAGRNRPCGGRKRSAASSQSMGTPVRLHRPWVSSDRTVSIGRRAARD